MEPPTHPPIRVADVLELAKARIVGLVLVTMVLAAALGSIAGCGDGREPLLVYTPHGRDQLKLLEQAFEAHEPGIDLRWLDMGSQEILDRLRFERENTQADVWYGGPSTIFDRGSDWPQVLAPISAADILRVC